MESEYGVIRINGDGDTAVHFSVCIIAFYPVVACGKIYKILEGVAICNCSISVKEIIAALNLAVVRIDFKACYLCIVNALELDGNSACCGHGSCRQNRFFGFGFLGNRLFGNNLLLLVKAELTRFLGKCHYGKH